ncbi:LysE family translocator [Teredinibacter sp. KSP-S5-2]|uniref:LysE family translocator n=1 Tax=Teredinibacter sp. KSP-S5-2 TaxID=3034506 RepID=UPI0029348D8E|nr:LysE family translocator [Teredinibacter sp. KSP-S5-2]WNO11536.1 LysE family translocator [Teredinibacter sp. KSP-S5-2]
MISLDFLITSFVVVLIPGTGVLYTISTGLLQGQRASVYAAWGCTLGILPSLTASVFGLALILHMSALAFQIIKYMGVVYLLYMAWSLWREAGALKLSEQPDVRGLNIVTKGFLLNILNPKLTLFFLAFLPQFIPHTDTAAMNSMVLLGGIFMLMTLLVFVLYGLLAGLLRNYVLSSERLSKIIQRFFSLSFAGLGVKLALTER